MRQAISIIRSEACTHSLERVAGARAAATAKGWRMGRPSVIDADKFAYANHLRDIGHTIAEILTKSGITRHQPLPLPPTTPGRTAHRTRG
jgi:hypothetical protein